MTEVVVTTLTRQDFEALVIDCMKIVVKHHLPRQEPAAQKPGPAGEGLLTKKQAAALLACSTSTVDNYARAGKLKRHYIGKSVRFKREDVLSLPQRKG